MVTRAAREAMALRAVADCARLVHGGPLELVVVGDPSDRPALRRLCAAAEAEDLPARWVASDEDGTPLGALRNLSLAAATHPRCLQVDDDDRHHPMRLAEQLAVLDEYSAGSCLTDQLYYLRERRAVRWVDWRRKGPADRLIPGTILADTELARCAGYPADWRKAEDTEHLKRLQRLGCVHAVSEKGWTYLRVHHGGNTWHGERFAWNAANLARSAGWLRGHAALLADALRAYDLQDGPLAVEDEIGRKVLQIQEYPAPAQCASDAHGGPKSLASNVIIFSSEGA